MRAPGTVSAGDVLGALAVASVDTVLLSRLLEEPGVSGWSFFDPPGAVILLAGLAVVPALAVRRTAPVLSALAVWGHAVAVCLALGSRPLLGLLLALYTLAVQGSRRQALAYVVLVVVADVLFVNHEMFTFPAELTALAVGSVFTLHLLFVGLAYAAGRWRRASQAEADDLRRSRETAAREAVTAERLRIARELHDIVAHSVTVMVLQSAGAQRVLGRDPDAARSAMHTVETLGKQTVSELRRLLEVLRSVSADLPDGESTPRLSAVDDLVEQLRAAGVRVTLTRRGAGACLDSSVESAAYRVVQEGLTNATRHAGQGAAVDVVIDWRDGVLVVEITDDGGEGRIPELGGLSIGVGLVGLEERVTLIGGSLEAGPRPAGGFRLRALLPGAHP